MSGELSSFCQPASLLVNVSVQAGVRPANLLTIVKVAQRWVPPSVGQWGRVKAECYVGANFEAIATDREA